MNKTILLLLLSLTTAIYGQTAHVLDSGLVFRHAPFASCHASTICQTATGDLLVAFFGGSWEGCKDVCIWSCRKNCQAKSWTSPSQIANGQIDGGNQHPCWNPVLYRNPRNNEILLFYKTGEYIPQWIGHIMRSNDGGITWSADEKLSTGLLGAIKNKPIKVSRRLIAPSSTEPEWQPHFEISTNNGRRWIRVDVPKDTSIIAIQPAILTLPHDTLLALMRTKNGYLAQTYSSDKGRHWSPMKLTNIPNNNSGIDAMTLKNGLHVMVYTPLGLNPESEFGPRTPLVVAISQDGHNWKTVVTLESKAGEYSYPSVIEDNNDGTLHIVYTYQRTHIKYAHIKIS